MSTQPHCIPGPPLAPRLLPILVPLAAIVLGTFMAILDNTVVTVALPTLARVLRSDLQQLQWVVTGYMLAQAAVIPLSGWLADRFGGKRVYLTAIGAFVTASVLCALAPTSSALIAFRILQGLGGGMLLPLGMAFLFRLSPPERRGAVMGAFSLPVLAAPALGPMLSGWLLEFADWRFIFLINLPIGVLALVLGWRLLPRFASSDDAGALDVPGALLGPIGFAALTFAVSESTASTFFSPPTLAALALGLAALLAFVLRELAVRAPLLELRVFERREFSRAVLTQWLAGVAFFGSMFLVPLYLQQARGFGALETGQTTLVQPITAAILGLVGGRVYDRLGARIPVALGLALVAAALWLLSQIAHSGSGDVRVPLAVWGAGGGLMMMTLNTHVLSSVPAALVDRVTALTSALQNVVGSLAIAVLSTALQFRAAAYELADPSRLGHAFGDSLLIGMVAGLVALLLAPDTAAHRGRTIRRSRRRC